MMKLAAYTLVSVLATVGAYALSIGAASSQEEMISDRTFYNQTGWGVFNHGGICTLSYGTDNVANIKFSFNTENRTTSIDYSNGTWKFSDFLYLELPLYFVDLNNKSTYYPVITTTNYGENSVSSEDMSSNNLFDLLEHNEKLIIDNPGRDNDIIIVLQPAQKLMSVMRDCMKTNEPVPMGSLPYKVCGSLSHEMVVGTKYAYTDLNWLNRCL